MDGLAEKDVVVEVDEVVGEVGNVVEVQLDGGGGERGKAVGHAEDVFVEHDADFGVGKVQPAGDLAVGHDVDVVDPRSVRLQGSDAVSRGEKRAQRLLQLVVVAETVHGDGSVSLTLVCVVGSHVDRTVVLHLLKPLRIGAIHPGVHSIDLREARCIHRRVEANVVIEIGRATSYTWSLEMQ